jgi:hypothetical protein
MSQKSRGPLEKPQGLIEYLFAKKITSQNYGINDTFVYLMSLCDSVVDPDPPIIMQNLDF